VTEPKSGARINRRSDIPRVPIRSSPAERDDEALILQSGRSGAGGVEAILSSVPFVIGEFVFMVFLLGRGYW